jgi:hypothetical protein
MTRVICAAMALACAFLSTVSCSGSHNTPAKSDGGADAGHEAATLTHPRSYAPTWTALQDEIFSRQCAIAFCHGGIAGAPPPFMSPDELVNAPASGPKCADAGAAGLLLVVPGHPEESLLHMKLVSPSPPDLCGDPMPGNGPPLDARDLQQVDDWITQGAQNN